MPPLLQLLLPLLPLLLLPMLPVLPVLPVLAPPTDLHHLDPVAYTTDCIAIEPPKPNRAAANSK
jgi:hypothetical protein